MAPLLLSVMPYDKLDFDLHLRLLNKWKVGNPSTPDQFYAFGTLWVDSEGTIIEGTSHRVFADILNDRFAIGSVYILARCTLDMPRKAFRTCSFSLMLVVSPSNIGGIVRSPSLDFPTTAFELTQFEDLAGRQSPCPYLSSLPFQFAVAFFLFLLLILSIRCDIFSFLALVHLSWLCFCSFLL
ncbi:hypothetical protein LINPERPRIM_LOCUS25747 [Linum perenne]